jgi:hypothetical protein
VAGIHPHTPRAGVVRVIKALECADGVVTIGGSSVGSRCRGSLHEPLPASNRGPIKALTEANLRLQQAW